MSQTARNRMSGILNAAFKRTRPSSPQPIRAMFRVAAPPPEGAARARYGAAMNAAPSFAPAARKSRRVNPGRGGGGMVTGPAGLRGRAGPQRQGGGGHGGK